jgi:hypothetical protein
MIKMRIHHVKLIFLGAKHFKVKIIYIENEVTNM